MRPEAVVFDIGNVLIEWQPERFYDAAIGVEKRLKMFSEVDLHAMNDEIDRGRSFFDTVDAVAVKYPEWRREIRMWHDHWIDLTGPAIDHSVRLLHALRAKGTPVFALTNFGVETFEIATEHYPFLTEFDRTYVSGQMEVIKPDADIYRQLEDDCGLSGNQLLFTDDRPDNINAAKARGWCTHVFSDAKTWAQTLVRYNFLKAEEAL